MDLRDRHESLHQGFAVARGVAVRAPPLHEGVGNALRHSYTPHADHIPEDMLQLLAKLK